MDDRLSKFSEERQLLLDRIVSFLEKDPRIVAAWLFGSLGRAEYDDLSDIDIWIVIADEFIQEISQLRRQFVSQIGVPLLVVEAPQNAPRNGAYLMVYYQSDVAPLQVDWYWQSQSDAFIPPDTKMLFDRVGLEVAAKPIVFTEIDPDPSLTEGPVHYVSYFWAMLLITTKYAMRDPWSEEMELLPYVMEAFHQTRQYLGLDISLVRQETLDQKHPKDKLRILRELAAEMTIMMRKLALKGFDMPHQFVPGMHNYLALFESNLQEIR